MSRIGKKPIVIPQGVKVSVGDQQVSVEGPKGSLSRGIVPGITVAVEDAAVVVRRPDNQRQSRAKQGLMRALIANMVKGVDKGFERALEISGVGYRAETSGDKIVLHLGYSHLVELPIPSGIEIQVEKNTKVVVRGIDNQLVGQVASKIRDARRPDPYKAKGVTYEGERILRKAGKKAVG